MTIGISYGYYLGAARKLWQHPSRCNGAVAGVIVAKLNALRIVKRTGTIPENVDFAVNAKDARALLDRAGVPYQTAADEDRTLSTPAIAERALNFTVLVQCFR